MTTTPSSRRPPTWSTVTGFAILGALLGFLATLTIQDLNNPDESDRLAVARMASQEGGVWTVLETLQIDGAEEDLLVLRSRVNQEGTLSGIRNFLTLESCGFKTEVGGAPLLGTCARLLYKEVRE